MLDNDVFQDFDEADMIRIDATVGNRFKTKQSDQQEEVFKGKSHRNLYTDTECPPSETYVGYVETKTTILNNSLVISDIELRKGDRMQFVTGSYNPYAVSMINTNQGFCLLGKFTTRGDLEEAKYLVKTETTHPSECYALSLLPDLPYLVVVGKVWGGARSDNDIWQKSQALIMMTDHSLNQLQTKVWTWLGDTYNSWVYLQTEARDVAVSEADGSIYVTGTIKGGFVYPGNRQNCFLLRLDSQLNKINARSIGKKGAFSTTQYVCNSIQLSRNADFIYLGGTSVATPTSRSELFFAKMDNQAERIATVSFRWQVTTALTYEMVGRRILLEQGKPFSAGNDNSFLYFCGFSHANAETRRGDIVFGRISSKDLSIYPSETAFIADKANAIKIEIIFRYGSNSDSEYFFSSWNEVPNQWGDCFLTADNANLVGVFSTQHQRGNKNTIPYTYQYALTTTNAAYSNPLLHTQQSCDNMQATAANMFNWFMPNHQTPPTTKTSQASWCETYYTNELKENRDNYKLAYSWRQCGTQYHYNMHSPICQIQGITFSDCDTYSSSWDDSHLSQHDNGAYTIKADCAASASNCPPSSCGTFICSEEACNQGRLRSCRNSRTFITQWNYNPNYGPFCFPTPTTAPNTCCQDCTRFVSDYNNEGWWYPSLNSGCKDWEFRRNGYNQVLAIDSWWNPIIYCDERTNVPADYCTANTAFTNTVFNTDNMYLIFEQDCRDSGPSLNYNMFIYRIDLSLLSRQSTYTGYQIPDAAVYFGDGRGHIYGQTIAVDEYGFIYVHGKTTSPSFGGIRQFICCNSLGSCCGSNQWNYRSVWIHLKTHWEMTHEIQHDTNLNLFFEQDPRYSSKKFIRPRRFRNDGTYSFLDLLYDHSCPLLTPFPAQCPGPTFQYTLTQEIMRGVPINARMYTLTTSFGGTPTSDINGYYQGHTLINVYGTGTQWASNTNTGRIWGYSYSRMNPIQEVRLNVSSTKQQFSMTLPQVCLAFELSLTSTSGGYQSTNRANQPKKVQWETKNQTFTNPTSYDSGILTPTVLTNLMSVKLTNSSGSSFSESHLSGTVPSTVTKGNYYMTLRSGTHYYLFTRPNTYQCSPGLKDYGFFMNTMSDTAHRRYESSVRIKLIVDRADSPGPQLLYNIDDIKPIVGQRYQYTIGITTYFSGCDRMRARKAYEASATFKTHQLPYWIKYHEKNSTFIIYPDQVSSIVDIQLTCCNVIDQCVTTSFRVLPQNNLPQTNIVPYLENYKIYLDKNIGQYFQWQMRQENFWDEDKASTALGNQYGADDTTYKLTDHRVYLDYSPAVSGFRFIQGVGLFFGQASTAHISLSALTGQYQFYDQYSLNMKQYGFFSLQINQLPQLTPLGLSYSFPTMDPTSLIDQTTSYFDPFFPFLQPESTISSQSPLFSLELSAWFTSTSPILYTVNSTDNSYCPPWLTINPTTGRFIIDPPSNLKSQLLNLQFTVTDQNQGIASVKKQILINDKPKVRSVYEYVKVARGKKVDIDLSWMISDSDNLVFQCEEGYKSLEGYSLIFGSDGHLRGKPMVTGRTKMVKISATDVHGESANTQFIVEIQDYRVERRDKYDFKDVSVLENKPFSFKIRDDTFYDQKEQGTLILFATDLGDTKLPNWINFDPASGVFYGIAPSKGTTQRIKIRAINKFSHDSITQDFKFYSVGFKKQPKPSIYRSPDNLEVTAGEFFSYTFPIDLIIFDTSLVIQDYRIILSQFTENTEIPSFITFNIHNLTIQGLAPFKITEKMIIRLDLLMNEVPAQNLKITINPKILHKPLKYYIIASLSFIFAITLYLGYLIHYVTLTPAFRKRELVSRVEASQKRFGAYQDINVKFIQVFENPDELPSNLRTISRDLETTQTTQRNTSSRGLLSRDSQNSPVKIYPGVIPEPDYAPESTGNEFKPPSEIASAQDTEDIREINSHEEGSRQIKPKVKFKDEVENIFLPTEEYKV